jgi:hypothetical protein
MPESTNGNGTLIRLACQRAFLAGEWACSMALEQTIRYHPVPAPLQIVAAITACSNQCLWRAHFVHGQAIFDIYFPLVPLLIEKLHSSAYIDIGTYGCKQEGVQ